jgi:hydrophobe/amphiphile efflux-1 (HAE1) family protein
MSGSSAQNGGGVSLTFAAGTNPDIAQVQVQNKLQQVLRLLPQVVQQQGVNVVKQTSGFLSMLAFFDKTGKLSATELGDFIVSTLQDPVARVSGVGNTRTFGSPFAMRIWLDPFKLNQFKLMPSDVRQALLAQNTQLSVGQLGAQPAVPGQELNATIVAQGRLRAVEQFRNIVLRVNTDGSTVHLSDVARVELGQDNYDYVTSMMGRPAVGLAVMLAPNANALKTSDAVDEKVNELRQFFPPGVDYDKGFDTAQFVRLSIREVVYTLIIAGVLVVLIMYLFLGNWRATLIPTIAVPVVLLGTFGVISAFGYSINTLTMFATVLAIGLLVDDAIVVVENVERLMHEEHLSPRDATIKSMQQITGALTGIALVLSAVFIPMAFFSGASGLIYRQFSITIVSAMLLSVIVALILSPAICASFLQPADLEAQAANHGFFGRFNQGLRYVTQRYQTSVAALLRQPTLGYAGYGAVLLLAALLLWRLPTGFIPAEDQGSLIAQVQLPAGATLERTLKVQSQLAPIILHEPSVRITSQMNGFSFGPSGQNIGSAFVRLKPWSERKHGDQSASAIATRLTHAVRSIRDANIFVVQQAAIRGLGNSSGFDLQLQDLAGLGHDALVAAREKFVQLAQASPVLAQVRAGGTEDQAEFRVDVDLAKAAALGLAPGDINDTLSSALGGIYVNDFINKNRVKKVFMQADAPYRMQPGDLNDWYVRNRNGEMVPVASIATTRWTRGPPRLERYNGQAALSVSGDAADGHTTGQAMAEAERLLQQLPAGIGFEWSGASREERKAGGQSTFLYSISILFVFLCLAALYESWSLPFTVILIVPVGVLGALLFTSLRGLSNDVYFQVALVTTIGLASKNAILIVEFAKKLHLEEGLELVEATLQAVRIRFRPILMTSMAFMLGVFPMVIASGPGAGGRTAIGTGVFGGMFAATLLGIFFIPLFFVLVQTKLARGHSRRPHS